MSRITLDDVPSAADFAARRPGMEREVLESKRARRVALGPHFTLLFENRVTLLWQVLEMCRVEHITRPDAIQHEIDTYAALLPGPRELSATLLLEYTDEAQRGRQLRALVGLHQHLWLDLGPAGRAPGLFDQAQFNEVRVASVHFVRFPLSEPQFAALANLADPAGLACSHPAYPHAAPLPSAARAALVEDLRAAG